MQRKFRIDIKGHFPECFIDSITQKTYADLSKASYGQIYFIGTDEELRSYCRELYKDETYFKVIGITEEKTKSVELTTPSAQQ